MNGFRNRILLPLLIPVGAAAILVLLIFNISRILLWLEEENSPNVATVGAIIAGSAVFFGCVYFAKQIQARTAGFSVLGFSVLGLVFFGGYGMGATDNHGAEEAAGEHGGEAAAAPAAGGTFDVKGTEFSFDPKEATVAGGLVTINLTNVGTVAHTFLLEGVADFQKVVAVKASTGTGTAMLEEGEYVFFCDETGHRAGGMEGKLTVTAPAAGAAAPTGGAAATTEVGATEFAFDPKELSVPAGPHEFSLKNTGTVAHTFLIEGVTDLEKIVATKGSTGTGTVDLKEGEYVFFCDETGHRAGGMEGKLTVTPGKAGAAAPKAGGGAAPAAGGGEEVEVEGKEFAFNPTELSAPAGTVTFKLKNTGTVVHTFLIEEVADLKKIVAAKAATGTGTVDLKPGEYVYFCDETGHRAAGMEGTLKVE
jgi:plastocyanin